jgi:hypothetical protein
MFQIRALKTAQGFSSHAHSCGACQRATLWEPQRFALTPCGLRCQGSSVSHRFPSTWEHHQHPMASWARSMLQKPGLGNSTRLA